jgi:hypothetical protein
MLFKDFHNAMIKHYSWEQIIIYAFIMKN